MNCLLTSVSAAMMIAESVNNTFGRTVNPLNRSLTSGGSSGGESALIAGSGSVLGIGTDIGESIAVQTRSCGYVTDAIFRWFSAYTRGMHWYLYTKTFFRPIPYR